MQTTPQRARPAGRRAGVGIVCPLLALRIGVISNWTRAVSNCAGGAGYVAFSRGSVREAAGQRRPSSRARETRKARAARDAARALVYWRKLSGRTYRVSLTGISM